MGPLGLPPAGLVYVDANVLIYSVERISRTAHFWNRCGSRLREAASPS